MKSSILIASYLWKDTWKRWREQPGSPLARLFVTTILVLVAAAVLAAFQIIERSLRERLERFGLDTLVIREPVSPGSAMFVRQGRGEDTLALLTASGRRLRLRQLFARAHTEWRDDNLPIYAYPPEALPLIAPLLSAQTMTACVSDDLPRNALLRVRVNRQVLSAVVARPPDWLRALSSEDFLLVPEGRLDDVEQLGWLDTTVFQRGPGAPDMDRIIAAVNALASVAQRPPPQMQSALPLMRELDDLQQRHRQWRRIMAVILGAAIALVYGAIAVLEFRQNLFVGALLRSFGAPSAILYFRHWFENLLLANLAAAAAILLLIAFQQTIARSLGMSTGDIFAGGAEAGLLANGVAAGILLWVNAGAFLSSLPVAAGLRQPVGEILS